mmetsp:Transcript_12281/g.16572  ORF Transcript_12281/g.16572 Transcript_12281/m.16572 type:complete len:717 (-) Transcript_12281:320-2470(-)
MLLLLSFLVVVVRVLSGGENDYLDELLGRVRELESLTKTLEKEIVMHNQGKANDKIRRHLQGVDELSLYEEARQWNSWTAYQRRKMKNGQDRRLDELTNNFEEFCSSLDTAWLIIVSLICFLLQAGFGLLETGQVRSKNAKSVLLKNTFDACAGGLAYYCSGWALSRGGIKENERAPKPEFAGDEEWMLLPDAQVESYELFFFQLVFATTVSTIVSGAVCERIQFSAYIIFTIFFVGIVYSLASHWTWSRKGYLYQAAIVDFAGGGTVHVLAGAASLVGAAIVGPREDFEPPITEQNDRRNKSSILEDRTKGHDATLSAVGIFLIWFALIPFNAGSALSVCGEEAGRLTSRVAVITLLCGCSGGSVSLIIGRFREGYISLEYGQLGVLAGLVSVASCCAVVEPWCAVWIISPLAVFLFWSIDKVQKKFGIDDPLRASSVHWGAGAISILAVGFFASPKYMSQVYLNGYDGGNNKCSPLQGLTIRLDDDFKANQADTARALYRYRRNDKCRDFYGIFYGGSGIQLAWQCAALLLHTSFALVTSTFIFGSLKYLDLLRVRLEDEVRGLDITHHGGDAYAWVEVQRRITETQRRRTGQHVFPSTGHLNSSGPPTFVGPPVTLQQQQRHGIQFDLARMRHPSFELARIDEAKGTIQQGTRGDLSSLLVKRSHRSFDEEDGKNSKDDDEAPQEERGGREEEEHDDITANHSLDDSGGPPEF